ncbi:MAG TPA: glycosyltransferase [Opitutaceae bacterium]|nr:glycosyltransferase [Opitutaceae bacterium]
MIVCDVTQFYSPYGGGVRRYLTEKRRFVNERTSDEHVLIIPGAETRYTREGRLHTYTISSPPINYTSRYRALLNQEALRQILRQVRPDVIESGDPYQVAWTALREAAAMNIPTVGFYHSHFPEAYLRTASKFGGPLARWIVFTSARRYVRHLYNHFDYTLVCAERIRGQLRDWGVDNVRPIKLGVDTETFTPGAADPRLRQRFGIPGSATLLLFVGRLAGEKNIAVLLEAFERVRRDSDVDFRLLCVGQGPWREQLLETREMTGGSVYWIPHISNSQELAAIYRAADLAVHPCINETFGLVPLEEQSCGLPVCGVAGSCLDDNIMVGLEHWAQRNDSTELAAAIERMQKLDLRGLGRIAAEKVHQRYAWPVVLDELWQHYRTLTAKKQPRRRTPRASLEAEPDIVIRKYHLRDRAAIRAICCDTGFLGHPIDPVFQDRELFADFMTAYYTDQEPESLFVLERNGVVAGYLSGCRSPARRRWYLLRRAPGALLHVATRYLSGNYNAATRAYLRWLISRGQWETPPRPTHTPHFHLNLRPDARSIPGTKALIDAFLAYLAEHNETAVYGQMIVFEDRRSDGLFSRFGFTVLNRREVTKYRDHYAGRVFLCTAWKNLSTNSRLEGARTRFLKQQSA